MNMPADSLRNALSMVACLRRAPLRKFFAVFSTALAAFLSLSLSQAQPGSLDTNFNAVLNNNAQVYVVTLQPNGQILIGGSFYAVAGQPAANLARLNPDG